MTIAIASKRPPKVQAVKNILEAIRQFLTEDLSSIHYLTYDTEGEISMPRTINEIMTGAKSRAQTLWNDLRLKRCEVTFCIGMEGGIYSLNHNGINQTFLQSWAYVSNGREGYFGSSGNILVPDRIASEVMINKRNLGKVIDEIAHQNDIRSNQGTWGILTRNFITRQRSFEIALWAAFAPFYNPKLYK